ncbi:MAG: hypothetical protein LBJ80_03610 [Rickettsiales bacterium]|nr:hypothetical protein [Rickettsiales bacterium]
MLEVIASSVSVLSSTYFRFNKFMIRKRAKERERKMYEDLETEEAIEAIIEINEETIKETSKREQKKQEKNILKTMAIIFLIVLVAAILETIALNFINSI